MPAKSLFELATAACIKNVRELKDVGDLPYNAVRTLLLKVDSARQLRDIEENSPQLQGETGEVWLKLIKHEFPMELKQKAYMPPNPAKWYRVYDKYKSDHQNALLESEAQLMNAMMGLKEDKEKNTSKIVDDRRLLPRGGRVGPKQHWSKGGVARDPNGSTLAFTKGSRTKTHNGASVMRKVRRETKEIASIHGTLSRPSQITNSLTRLRKAPAAMVDDYQRASRSAIRAPRPKPEPSAEVIAHEERAQFLSDSESDGGGAGLFDDDDDDEEPPPRKTVSRPSSSTVRKPVSAPSNPPVKARRSGLLSNSYKGLKPQTTTTSSQPRPSRPVEKRKPSPVPERTVLSSSPEPEQTGPASSPPPVSSTRPPLGGIGPRKRKGAGIFMTHKRRA